MEGVSVIAVTGHRPQSLDGDFDYKSNLWEEIYRWFDRTYSFYRPEKVLSGMALGVDTIAAKCAVDLEVPLVACIPFKGQDSRWGNKAKKRYKWLLDNASEIIYTDDWWEHFRDIKFNSVYQKLMFRNMFMVDHCDTLLGVFNGNSGGTKHCIDYAVSKGIRYDLYRLDHIHGHQIIH